MKRSLLAAVVLAITASASAGGADLQVFFSNSKDPFGLTNKALAFDPTLDLKRDAEAYHLIGPAAPEPAPATIHPNGPDNIPGTADDEFAYVWFRFNAWNGCKTKGVHLKLDTLAPNRVDIAYYVMDDTEGVNYAKRWNGPYTPPLDPEFKDPNPSFGQALVAMTAAGLMNTSNSSYDWNLYDKAKRTYLLAAVRFAEGHYTANMSRGILGINIGSPPPPSVEFLPAHIVPEPATLMLFGLLGPLLCRR